MAPVTKLQIENYVFPPTMVKPVGSNNTFFLAGAGSRGLEIEGRFVKFTAIAVYLEESAIPFLAAKWKGKSSEELTDSVEFFKDIVTGPFEKFTQVTMILPLTGKQYSEKVAENCVANWKAIGTYSDAESQAIEKFLNVFQSETFPHGASILFTQSPLGSLTIENYVFPPTMVKPVGSNNTFFLAGAGNRGLEIEGRFVKFTAIGVYLEESAIPFLAAKWKGKSSEELTDSVEFFRDIVTAPFEKFTRVTMILPLTGKQYSEKVAENCVAYWKAIGTYNDAESQAIEKFLNVFQSENFPPGASILFTQSPLGSLTISFSKDDSVPSIGNAVIENKQLSEEVLDSIIGKHGVSPAAKSSIAKRVSELFRKEQC